MEKSDSNVSKKQNTMGPITQSIIDGVAKELNKKKTKDKIVKNIINPIVRDVIVKYQPHLITLTTVFVLIILLLISILIIIILSNK